MIKSSITQSHFFHGIPIEAVAFLFTHINATLSAACTIYLAHSIQTRSSRKGTDFLPTASPASGVMTSMKGFPPLLAKKLEGITTTSVDESNETYVLATVLIYSGIQGTNVSLL